MKNFIQKNKLNIKLQVTLELRAVHLINQKLNGIIIEENTAWKGFERSGNENN